MVRVASALLAFALPSAVRSASCVDESGASVDWWFALKYPLAASDSCAGTCYSYMDSSTLKWQESTKLVTDTDSIIGLQMADIYAQKSGLSYVPHDLASDLASDRASDGPRTPLTMNVRTRHSAHRTRRCHRSRSHDPSSPSTQVRALQRPVAER